MPKSFTHRIGKEAALSLSIHAQHKSNIITINTNTYTNTILNNNTSTTIQSTSPQNHTLRSCRPLCRIPPVARRVEGCCCMRLRGSYKWGYKFPNRCYPEGPTYTTIMELGPRNQNRDGFFGA